MNYSTLILLVCAIFISNALDLSESKYHKSKGIHDKEPDINLASKLKKRSISSGSGLLSSHESGEEEDEDEHNGVKLAQLDDKNATEKNSNEVSDFKIPGDYNKLKVPTLNRKKYLEKKYGAEEAKKMIKDQIESEEDENIRVPIMTYVLLRSIREVDELEEEITVELDFVTTWVDLNLCIANKCDEQDEKDENKTLSELQSVDPSLLKSLWKPDLFIENVVKISRPELIMKPTKVLFTPKGYIVLQTRVTVIMDCEMEFKYYPADTQHCVFKIRSYSHTSKELELVWNNQRSRNGVFLEDRDENNFDVKVESVNSTEKIEWQGLLYDNYSEEYTILEFTVCCRRKLSYHLIQTYLPSVFFIIITWLCFLIPSTMVEARIGVSMTTLLTLTSMFSSVRESTPIVSYTKAIDIWMVACIFAVFLTLLEFTVLIWLRHKHKENSSEAEAKDVNGSPLKLQGFADKRQEQKDEVGLDNLEPLDSENNDLKNRKRNLSSVVIGFVPGATHLNNKEKVADWIEKNAFLIFSLLFFIFNIFYWSWLLHFSKYFDWEVNPMWNTV